MHSRQEEFVDRRVMWVYIQVLVLKGQLQADKHSKPHSWLKIKQ